MKLPAAKFFGAAFTILISLLGLSFALGERHAVGMLLPTTAIGGFVAFAVVGLLSCRMKRLFGLIDGLRCTGWMLIGSSVGLQQISYYRVFFPQYAAVAITTSIVGVVAGVLVIVIASALLTAPKAPEPGCCKACGYNLTGNTSGVCPECGGRR